MPTRRHWIQQIALAGAGLGFSPALQALPAAKRPDSSQLILLNSNENAFGPSPKTVQAIKDIASMSNRYPDDYLPDFRKKLSGHWGVQPENLAMGGGATEILALICQMLGAEKKGQAITAVPAYSVWQRQAAVCGISTQAIPLNAERQLDLPAMLSAINADTRMFYLCNPNNPTGGVVPIDQLRPVALEASKKTLVVVDEAYNEFAGLASLAPEAVKNPNLIVLKTFSKVYGLAGARLGYAIGHPDTIGKIAALQGWRDVTISMVTCAAASAALDDRAFVQACIKRTAQNRERCIQTFRELGLPYLPSQTSFMLFDIGKLKGDFAQRMQAENIMVQYRDHFGGKWCRVSMGTEPEMEAFCKALRKISA